MKIFQKNATLFYYLSATIFSCCILAGFLYTPEFNIHFPLNYKTDGLAIGSLIKTIIETGWYGHSIFLSAPGVYDLADYPSSDHASIFILKIISLISSNYPIILNSFYFLTFPLVTLTSLYVFRYCKIERLFAWIASLLFTFLPYHFLREESHLFLSAYYVVPLYVFLTVSVFFQNEEKKSVGSWIRDGVICLFAASSGVYYAFFGAYFILLAGVIKSINKKEWKHLLVPAGLIAVLGLTILLNTLPNRIENSQRGSNPEAAKRSPRDSEQAGLKIVQMVLPVDGYRLPGLRKAKNHYTKTAPLVNENRTASLGIIGVIGFFYLLLLLLHRHTVDPLLFLLSRLNLFAVLLGTIGGLGTIFAYCISPTIRSYNRISVFIAFFSLCGFFLLLQRALTHKYKLRWVIALFILCLGLLDEIPVLDSVFNYKQVQSEFKNDADFIARIEAQLPPGSLIFQLPYMLFPESEPIFLMTDHDPFRGYLHSHTLKWSYGAMRGRPVATWQKNLSQQPLAVMVIELRNAGFAGIYLDRNGYADKGKSLETQLKKLLHKPALVSLDGRFIFYDIRKK